MEFIKLFFTGLITGLILDGLWLGLIAKNLYQHYLGAFMRKSNGALAPIWSSAVIVYLAIILGLVFFVVPKAEGNAVSALLWGAAFGAIMYAIYDFTNHTVLANWPLEICLIDVAWGSVLCGVTSFVMVKVVS